MAARLKNKKQTQRAGPEPVAPEKADPQAADPRRDNPRKPSLDAIVVSGARTHNLQSIHCRIPRARLTVVSGVSGSGKSSLAFDTLFAEGQRRYVESLSSYARQFLERMPRPDVDAINHIPPAIALEQKNSVRNARSTIGTATEINDYLRLLYAKIGRIVCPDCNEEVRRDTPESILRVIAERKWPPGTRLHVLAPVVLDDPALFPGVVQEMRREGYTRLRIGERLVDTTDPSAQLPLKCGTFEVVVDRFAWRGEESDGSRLTSAVQNAFRLGKGHAVLLPESLAPLLVHETLLCRSCQRAFRAPEPRLFSFYNPLGACKTCQGFGRVIGLDWEKIIPNPKLSLDEGCVAAWNTPTAREMYDYLRSFPKLAIPWDVPFERLSETQRRRLVDGEGKWPGIRGFFQWLEEKRYKVQNRVMLARYRGYTSCPDCKGTRLVPDALHARIAGKTIAELWAKSVKDLRRWFLEELALTPIETQTAQLLLREIHSRLNYLMEVGLGYLTLDRQTRTLSGGESQRINLATALGSALTETLYVLDEPTVGLHPRDTHRLVGILQRLVELGNTVVVVEHDLDVIRSADHLVDLGPRAGEQGGKIVFEGSPAEAAAQSADAARASLTARYLAELEAISATAPERRGKKASSSAAPTARAPASPTAATARRQPQGWITILGAYENNLRQISVEIPLHAFVCVTGVSGSGKTTLVSRCLYANYMRARGDTTVEPGRIVGLEGVEALDDMIFVDQSPIGRSARSNAATYLKAWDWIRDLLASTREARHRGLRPRDFSFNVEGGRCEACQGTGTQTIDMQFLADVTVTCDRCDGKRFQNKVLEVTYEGCNVTRILDMTVREALRFFEGQTRITRGLQPLDDVGLGYLRLGQSTATLSGGEAQRLKLAAHLANARSQSNVLLLFDEPTTGLHPADLDVLLGVFDRLLDQGFSILVIEHNLEMIRRADWIIDLGPEGGDEGGELVAAGPPEAMALHPNSHTGRYLRSRLSPTELE